MIVTMRRSSDPNTINRNRLTEKNQSDIIQESAQLLARVSDLSNDRSSHIKNKEGVRETVLKIENKLSVSKLQMIQNSHRRSASGSNKSNVKCNVSSLIKKWETNSRSHKSSSFSTPMFLNDRPSNSDNKDISKFRSSSVNSSKS